MSYIPSFAFFLSSGISDYSINRRIIRRRWASFFLLMLGCFIGFGYMANHIVTEKPMSLSAPALPFTLVVWGLALWFKIGAERIFWAWILYMRRVDEERMGSHALGNNLATQLLRKKAAYVQQQQSQAGVYDPFAIATKQEFEALFSWAKILRLIDGNKGYGEFFKS